MSDSKKVKAIESTTLSSRKFKFSVLVIALTTIFCMNSQLFGQSQPISPQQDCGNSWFELKKKFGNDPVGLERSWKSLESKCKGTGIYEYRLATLLAKNGELEDALRLLDQSIKANLPLSGDMEILVAGYKFDSAILKQLPNASEVAAAVNSLEQVVAEHPQSQSALASLSMAHLYQERFNDVVADSEKLISLNDQLWEAHRNLAIALIYTNRSEMAKSEINRVLAMNPEAKFERDFALALAQYYLQIGDQAGAKMTLQGLIDKTPTLKTDPEVIKRSKQAKFNLPARST